MSIDSQNSELDKPGNPFVIEAKNGLIKDGEIYFNNFPFLFPASKELVSDFADYRRMIKKISKESYKIGDDYKSAELEQKHSKKWLEQTWEEFFAEIDKAVGESGFSLKDIQDMRDQIERTKDFAEREKLKYKALEELIPVYAKLREMGYERYDLTI